MKLYGPKLSPFVRKCLIAAGELGLTAQLEPIHIDTVPLGDPGLRAKNPLKKVPFLEMPTGELIYDSRVVCEVLAQQADNAEAVYPAAGVARIEMLTRQALSDGCADAAVSVSYERRLRPEERQWPEWMDMQLGRVDSALDVFEAQIRPEGRFDLGDCALAGLLLYLGFRFVDRPWYQGRPQLKAWFEQIRQRPSVMAVSE